MSISLDSGDLESAYTLGEEDKDQQKGLRGATPVAGKETCEKEAERRRADLLEMVVRTMPKVRKCKRNAPPLLVQLSQVFPVPGFICGC